MAQARSSATQWLIKGGIFLVFLIVEATVFAILPLSARFPIRPLLSFQAALAGTLLLLTFLLRRSVKGKRYWQIGYAFFVAATAVLLSVLYSDTLLRLFGLTATNPQGIAVAKFSESLWRVGAILVLMTVAGADLPSLYLQKGRIGLGLAVGFLGSLLLAAIAFAPLAGQPGMSGKLLSLSPWVLIFVLANGFNEELLYRGLFLKRYQPFLGKGLSNLLAALVFTLVHVQVTYVANLVQFLVILFPLALIWGYLMQKTDSIWGSALFHAGADCIIIFGIFASV
jgi:membrane protease YdiL (CAAX protease family)